jgi:hypothetical protein
MRTGPHASKRVGAFCFISQGYIRRFHQAGMN